MLLSWPSFVVSRRINRPLAAVQSAIADPANFRRGDSYGVGADGALTIDQPFRLVTSWPGPSWRAAGRLFARGPRAVARVELEVAAWSGEATELTIRPVSRHPERWGRRRLQQYFALAHDSADRGMKVLTAYPEPVPVDPRALVRTGS
jgi:hypothetical protein